jgi:hypothetical protein
MEYMLEYPTTSLHDAIMYDRLVRGSNPRIGPGRKTVFTDHNYINDPRRKQYKLGDKQP